MKKYTGVLFAFLFLLILCGAAMASQCEHNVRCTDTTTCLWCPETNVTTYEWVTHHYVYTDKGKEHQAVCQDCGDEGGSGQHTVYCTDPDYCTVCELTLTDFPVVSMIHDGSVVCLDAEQHQWKCAKCDYAHEAGLHYGYCKEPGVCDYCDAAGVTIQPSKLHHSMKYVNLGENHRQECQYCDKVDVPTAHRVSCSSGGVCSDCGATGLTVADEDLRHQTSWVNLGETHQLQCKNCDYVTEPSPHSVKCAAPDYCTSCGATGVTVAPENMRHSFEYVDAGAQHERKCKICGYVASRGDHRAYCDTPDTCTVCKATGLIIPENKLRHEWEYVDIGEQHQRHCVLCDRKQESEDHVAMCHEPGVCVECGAEIAEVDEDHLTHEGEMVNLGDTHRFECENCDYTFEGSHFVLCADPTVCIDCEASGLNVSESLIECIGPFTFAPLSAAEHRRTCGECGRTKDYFHNYDNGNVCVCGQEYEDRLAGDATGDDHVTIEDALTIAEYVSGENVGIDLYNADVTGDGVPNLDDVLRLLQYLAGWNVTLK